MNDAPPILKLAGIGKRFPGVQALRAASLEVLPGEIHALVGQNGAGKSTLIRVVTGAHRPDEGSIEVAGVPASSLDPSAARRLGIAAIYQELSLVPALTVRENLFLGREPARRGWIDAGLERRQAAEICRRLGLELDPEARVRDLPLAQQQLVEIARALLADARIIIMDEPTAALTPGEVERLFRILEDLRRRGHGVVFVSHRLNEVLRIADRITVMRDGATLGVWTAAELTADRLVELMAGHSLRLASSRAEAPVDRSGPRAEDGEPGGRARDSDPGSAGEERSAGTGFKPVTHFGVGPAPSRPARAMPAREPLLRVEELRGGRIRGVSFELRAGEILGLAGLVGAGRTEVCRLLFGADRIEGGRILIDGVPVRIRSPREAMDLGICLLTEDRKGQGLVLGLSARDNFALPNLNRWSVRGWIRQRVEAEAFLRRVRSLDLRLSGPDQPAGHLSGGNQQKLLVARLLEGDARLVLFDEPTRGIDVAAKAEMALLIRDLADRGKGVLLVSSELSEILALSDRVLVMHEGRITGEIRNVAQATEEQVLGMAVR